MWNQETRTLRKALKHSIILTLPNSVAPSRNPSLNLSFFFLFFLSREYLRALEKTLKSPLLSALNLGREQGPELLWKSRAPHFWVHSESSQGEGCTENYSPLLLQHPPTPQTSCKGRKAQTEHTGVAGALFPSFLLQGYAGSWRTVCGFNIPKPLKTCVMGTWFQSPLQLDFQD